jgi:hypothetical protein
VKSPKHRAEIVRHPARHHLGRLSLEGCELIAAVAYLPPCTEAQIAAMDGGGNLSRKALTDFTVWFLQVCLDQVTFMSGLFARDTLIGRLRTYAARRQLKPEAGLSWSRCASAVNCREARPAASAA